VNAFPIRLFALLPGTVAAFGADPLPKALVPAGAFD
jgi:hypothetical protein